MPKKFDLVLLLSALLLTGIGLIVMHAINFRDPLLAQDFDPIKQVIAAVIGLAGLIIAARTDYRLWSRLAIPWYLLSLGLLGGLLVFGDVIFGATRSIDLGVIEFQPTELAKLGLIFILAKLYARNAPKLKHPQYMAYSLLLLGGVVGLVLLQPDLGSTAVFAFIWLVMTLISRVPKVYILVLLVVGLAVSPLLISQMPDYQQERLRAFTNPAADLQAEGYNVNQAMIAVGSGQLFGRGLSGGTQSQLNFLPSQHTDFAFAVLAEKLGLLGAGLVVALFMVLLGRAILIVWRCQDWFGVLLGSGIIAVFLFHIVVTLGMNLGIVPVTGLPLPFISYGGTNLIVSLFMIGILESIATQNTELQFKE